MTIETTATPIIVMHPVESSQLAAIGHDAATDTLAIEFIGRDGAPGSTYRYANFPSELFAEFQGAESIGKHFYKHIKPFSDRYPYTKIDAAPAAPMILIQALAVERDAEGFWSHPGIPDFDEDTDKYKAWLELQGLVTEFKMLDSEVDDHPACIAYFENEASDISAWTPVLPDGDGWFTLWITDTEDGPIWVWGRRAAALPVVPQQAEVDHVV